MTQDEVAGLGWQRGGRCTTPATRYDRYRGAQTGCGRLVLLFERSHAQPEPKKPTAVIAAKRRTILPGRPLAPIAPRDLVAGLGACRAKTEDILHLPALPGYSAASTN